MTKLKGGNMKKDTEVIVTGHRNPDTDSICSAIAYAELKRRVEDMNAVPVKLGPINRETKFVLDYFGVKEPELKESMRPVVSDLHFDKPHRVSKWATTSMARSILQEKDAMNLQVVDDQDRLEGLVSISDLMKTYIDVWDEYILGRSDTPIENILEVLRGKIIFRPEEPRPHIGRMAIYAMDSGDVEKTIGENDIVLVGNREDAQLDAIDKKVAILIITNGSPVTDKVLKKAEKERVTLLGTELETFLATRLLPLSVPVGYNMTQGKIISFEEEDFVDDIRDIMSQSRYRAYPVLDHKKRLVGSISRFHLITNKKKPIILVDHNERNQSVPDIDYAQILEIIDHHRVANIMTESPVFFRNEPVGSTSTIVAKMYFEQGVNPTRSIAGLMCAAIISDTLLLRSPTATDDDRRMLERMSKIANIDIEEFADEMFRSGTSLDTKSMDDLISEDTKIFDMGGEKVRIAQVMTMDLENLDNIKEQLIQTMRAKMAATGDSVFMLIFTDILKETSRMIVLGDYSSQIARAFGQDLVGDTFLAPGVLSRKKQVVPVVTDAVLEQQNM